MTLPAALSFTIPMWQKAGLLTKEPAAFARILLVADFSGKSSLALRYAKTLAKEQGATLLLEHSIDPIAYAFDQGVHSRLLQDDDGARDEVASFAGGEELRHPTHPSIRKRNYKYISEAAQEHNASLLILSTRGRTIAASAALGIVAREILPTLGCPLLTLMPQAEQDVHAGDRWGKVLVATDFSSAGIAALRCAQLLARDELIVLHSTLCDKEQECSQCLARLRFLVPSNASNTPSVEHLISSGEAGMCIANIARMRRPDLLVMGAPDTAIAGEKMGDSTIYLAVSHSVCPVLLVPAVSSGTSRDLIKEVLFAG